MSAVPIYSWIRIGLPSWLIGLMRKIMSAFFWTGTDIVQNGKTLVAWSCVQCPLHLGGLGVLDVRLLGVALRVRWLWLLKTDPDLVWTSLPCPSDSLTMALFEASVELHLGNGESFFYRTDAWFHGARLADLAPDLVCAVSTAAKKWQTVVSAPTNHVRLDPRHNGCSYHSSDCAIYRNQTTAPKRPGKPKDYRHILVALGAVRCLLLSLGLLDHVCRPVCNSGGCAALEIKGTEQMPLLHVGAAARPVLDGRTTAPPRPLLLCRMHAVFSGTGTC
jgi:hypothetical protein